MHLITVILRIGTILALPIIVAACAHPQPHDGGPGHSAFYDGVVGVYTDSLNHLSAVRRGSCPMHPSCAQYSRQAVSRNGFFIGWTMTMDRLLRCGRDELETAPRVFVDGQWKFYDPVRQNEIGRGKTIDARLPSEEKKGGAAATAALQHPAYRISPD